MESLKNKSYGFILEKVCRPKTSYSLGDDTDTTGAVYGQIAGAYYGLNAIPWRKKITWSEKIHTLAENLYKINKESRDGQ